MKKLQDLTIKDAFMFAAVMSDAEQCKLLLALILEMDILEVDVVAEKSLSYHPEYHGVRLDVLAEERGMHRRFNVEMQVKTEFSYHSPDSYVDTNIKGTLNVLNAARELGTQRVLVTSTSEVYGTAQYVPIDEKHPFQGQSPYSATKIGADRLAESFYRSFDLPVTIVRPFNTYGPRQSGRAIIPTIITQLLAGQTEIKLGSLTPTRDFNYVKDTANGFMTIADCDAAIGQELNIATGIEHSIGDLANELIAQINPNAKIVCEAERLRPEKSEVNRLLGDSTKLRELTGWAPQYTFEQGLAATIEFLRGNLDQYKVGQYIL